MWLCLFQIRRYININWKHWLWQHRKICTSESLRTSNRFPLTSSYSGIVHHLSCQLLLHAFTLRKPSFPGILKQLSHDQIFHICSCMIASETIVTWPNILYICSCMIASETTTNQSPNDVNVTNFALRSLWPSTMSKPI